MIDNQEKDQGIRAIQKRGLEILLEVDRLCKTHQIQYFLEGGTLLGAVRHQGFIPWDDDVDIVMLRDDYEKFLQVAPKALNERYFLQTYRTDPYFPFGFARVLDTKSQFPDVKSKFKSGFCLDIFPIDNASDLKVVHRWRIFLMKVIQALSKSKINLDLNNYQGVFTKIIVLMAAVIGKLFPNRFLMWFQNRIATGSHQHRTKYKCIYSYPYHFLNRLFPSEAYQEVDMLPFEGYHFPAPKGWDLILTELYGDYMTPPPIEKQVPLHGFSSIKFFDDDELNEI